MTFLEDLWAEIVFWTGMCLLGIAIIVGILIFSGIITGILCCKKKPPSQVTTVVPVNTVTYTIPVEGRQQVVPTVPTQSVVQPLPLEQQVEQVNVAFTEETNLSDQPPSYTEVVLNKE